MSTALSKTETPTAPTAAPDRRPFLSPPVDIFRGENGWLIRADLPGVTPDDLSVDLHENRLTIEGRRPTGPEGEAQFGRPEIAGYRRTLIVPDVVDADAIDASLVDGVLELTLPRDQRTRSRRIAVNAN